MPQRSYQKAPMGGHAVLARELRIGDRTIYGNTIADVQTIEHGAIVLIKYNETSSAWFRSDERVLLMERGPE